MSTSEFSCPDCSGAGEVFATDAALRKHRMKTHGTVFSSGQSWRCPIVLTCPLCPDVYSFSGNATVLKTHYENDHNVDLKKYEKVFTSMEDFDEWKSDLEVRTGTEFIKRRKAYKTTDGTEKLLLICSRDGSYKSRSTGLRTSKIQGTKKINAHCPAGMKICVSAEGIIRVNVIETHVGHSMELGQFALTKAEKEEVARKIESKLPFTTILEDVRKSGISDRLTRKNLLNRQDLYNIKKGFALSDTSSEVKQSSNPVESWVERMNLCDPVVRYYKPQGQEAFPKNGLQSEDLVLVFFNNGQLDILKKFSEKCICIDRVSTNLVTLLVVDDFYQGYPVAFLITNRMDSTVLKLFLETLKAAIGYPIYTEIFMCGVDQGYHNIWSEVMVPAGRVLYSSWLVNSDWRSQLMTIKDKSKQDEVGNILKKITDENDENTFNILLEEVCRWLVEDVETVKFGMYFIDMYGSSATHWAYCYRKTVIILSKTQLERVHTTLEHINSEGRTKEPEKAVQDLLRFSNDRLYDRLVSNVTISSTLKELERVHNKIKLLTGCDVDLEGNDWVLSFPKSSKVVRISKNNVLCDCVGKCPLCKGCSHMYLCSCLNSLVKWKMCGHIHYLCEYFNNRADGTKESPMGDAGILGIAHVDQVLQVSSDHDRENIPLDISAISFSDLDSENSARAMIPSEESLPDYKLRVNNMLKAMMDLVNRADGIEEVQMYEGLIKPVVTNLEARGCFNGLSRPLTEVTLSTTLYTNNQSIDSENSARRKRKFDEFVFDDSSTILVVKDGESDIEPDELFSSKVEDLEIGFGSDDELGYAEEILM